MPAPPAPACVRRVRGASMPSARIPSTRSISPSLLTSRRRSLRHATRARQVPRVHPHDVPRARRGRRDQGAPQPASAATACDAITDCDRGEPNLQHAFAIGLVLGLPSPCDRDVQGELRLGRPGDRDNRHVRPLGVERIERCA
jgi:hypothetical protein